MSEDKAGKRIGKQDVVQGRRRSPMVWIILLLVIVILVGVILYLLLKPEEEEFNSIVTPDNVDQILAQMADDDKTPYGSYEAVMKTNWEFGNGEAVSSNAYVENNVSNRNTVFFTVALKDDPEEVIYQSPYIEVGSSLTNIKLDKALDAGTYSAVITYHLVDEDYKESTAVSMGLTITIKN